MEADRDFFQEHDADKSRAELNLLKKGKDTWGKLKAATKLPNCPTRDYFVRLETLQQQKQTKNP